MPRDDAYLLDILIAARKARKFVEDISRVEFGRSDLHQSAVIRALEVIGEAARRVSDSARDAHPEIPWEQMIGMRNRLLHEYSRVNVQTVWDTVQNDLPDLIRLIEPLVPPEDESDAPSTPPGE
jgi:uncharacterized protein with HEPN domain